MSDSTTANCASLECDEDMLSNEKDKKRKHEDEKCDSGAEDEAEGDVESSTPAAADASKKKKKNKKRKSKAAGSSAAPVKKEAENEDSRIPVTVLTGFLGSGKTTLLNRILTENHGLKIAVIENEFGEVGVDNELVIQEKEQVVEMNNGCICCTVRGDLIKILMKLHEQSAAGAKKIDRVLVETTGLADPSPVAQTFFVEEAIAEKFKLDGIVTMVDCYHILGALEQNEAQEQVAFADIIVLNKTDLVDNKHIDSVEAKIRNMNANAKIFRAKNAQVEIAKVLDIGGFNVRRALDVDPKFFEPEFPFEWVGAFELAKGSYTLVVPKGPDASMTVVFMHKLVAGKKKSDKGADSKDIKMAIVENESDKALKDSKIKAALDAAKTMTSETADEKNGFAAAVQNATRTAMLAFSDRNPKSQLKRSDGEKLSPTQKSVVLDLAKGDVSFTLTVPDSGVYLLFTEHQPVEFNMRLVKSSAGSSEGESVKPAFEKSFKPDHEHADEVTSVGLQTDLPLDCDKLNEWLGTILRSKGNDIFRMKGVFNIKGWEKRFVFHGVHMLFNGSPDRPWGKGEKRMSTAVFIGRNLDRQELNKSFFSVVAR